MVTMMIVTLGAAGFGCLSWAVEQGWRGFPSGSGGTIMLTLALLAPVQALDAVCVQTLACFSKPKQILLRKHVLGPGLRVLAVVAAFIAGGSNEVLATTYLAAGILGLIVCMHLVVRELYNHRVLPRPVSQWQVPWSPLLSYSLPLISTDLVAITLTGVTTVLLMAAGGVTEIASMRAVAPAAALNMLVSQSFVILFMPSAMRLFARNDIQALSHHHWESVGWVAVLSFPIFALTFGIAIR